MRNSNMLTPVVLSTTLTLTTTNATLSNHIAIRIGYLIFVTVSCIPDATFVGGYNIEGRFTGLPAHRPFSGIGYNNYSGLILYIRDSTMVIRNASQSNLKLGGFATMGMGVLTALS